MDDNVLRLAVSTCWTRVSRKYGSVIPSTPALLKYQSSSVAFGRAATAGVVDPEIVEVGFLGRNAGVEGNRLHHPVRSQVDLHEFRPAWHNRFRFWRRRIKDPERVVVIDDQHSYVSDGRLVDGGAFVFGPGVRASHSLVI